MMNNSDQNAVTPGCELMCQRQNMRQIISDAFTLKNIIEAIVSNERQQSQLNIVDYELEEIQPNSFYAFSSMTDLTSCASPGEFTPELVSVVGI